MLLFIVKRYVSIYKADITASTNYTIIKYLELIAAGCLTFMEVSAKNRDAEFLGFVDNENALFINEKNYKQKFQDFLSNPDDIHWKQIADNGRNHTLTKLNNDKSAEPLIEIIKEVI